MLERKFGQDRMSVVTRSTSHEEKKYPYSYFIIKKINELMTFAYLGKYYFKSRIIQMIHNMIVP